MKVFIVIFILPFWIWSVSGQVNNSEIPSPDTVQITDTIVHRNLFVISKVYKDSLVLRWAPDNELAWRLGNQYGYIVERLDYETKGTLKGDRFKPLQSTPLKPLSSQIWENHPLIKTRYMAIAWQAVYGTQFTQVDSAVSPVSLKSAMEEEKMRYSFALLSADMEAGTANCLGLRFTDKTIQNGKRYIYRIYSLIPKEKVLMDTVILMVNADEVAATPIPVPPECISQEKSIRIEVNTELMNSAFTSYFIEKSYDGGHVFSRVNEIPITETIDPKLEKLKSKIIYIDSVDINYHSFYYRIIGITPFGELSNPSESVAQMARDFSPPEPPLIDGANDIGKLRMQLKWSKSKMEEDFKGYKIAKGSNYNGPFKFISDTLLPSESNYFIDHQPDTLGVNYYAVFAFDTAGNYSSSIVFKGAIIDSFPPSIPSRLTGQCDSNGVVTIKWDLGKELDIIGYRVFFANDLSHEFSNRTPYPHQDTIFFDTIQNRTLTKNIYYKICAVDRNFNHSKFSEILSIRRPDYIPPVPAVFSGVKVTDTSVYLTWIPSTSDDVMHQDLYRRKQGEHNWVPIKQWKNPNIESQYLDKQVEGGSYYEYTLLTEDSSGLKSDYTIPIQVKVYRNSSKKQIGDFIGQYDKKSKQIDLSWNFDEKGDFYFVIYRSYNNSSYSAIKSIDNQIHLFHDKGLIGKGNYKYGIKAIFKNGSESLLKESIIIQVK